jgi:hypothetical protein
MKGQPREEGPWWARAAPEAQSLAEIVDPEIEALPLAGRAKLGALWQARGALELRVAAGFSALSFELLEHGAPPVVYATVGQAIRDEIRHAEISVEIASKYRGDAPIWPEPEPTNVPPFVPTTGAMHATLYVIAMCCLNETIACGVLQAGIALTKSPLIRAALGVILEDEIEHARAGWAYMGSSYVTAEMKQELPKWVHRAHVAKLREFIVDPPTPEEDFADHGILSRARLRQVVRETLGSAVFPGFRRAGIDPSLAERWVRGAFDRRAARVLQAP